MVRTEGSSFVVVVLSHMPKASRSHFWRAPLIFGITRKPGIPLSTLPAIATGLFGALTGHWLRSERDRRDPLIGLFLFGFLGIVVGSA